MTIIAWDGKTLAADRRFTSEGLIREGTKLYRLKSGELFAACGENSFCLQMKVWIEEGCFIDKFPAAQRDKDDWQVCVVVGEGGLRVYERTPYPIIYATPYFACGSGRDYATAAMYLGKTAKESVEIASMLDPGCGNGVDTMTWPL